MSKNPAYSTVKKHNATFTELLQYKLSVSADLWTKNLVTEDVHYQMSTPGISNYTKASLLTNCVADVLSNSPQKYRELIEVLSDVPFFEDLVKKLESTYCKLYRYLTERAINTKFQLLFCSAAEESRQGPERSSHQSPISARYSEGNTKKKTVKKESKFAGFLHKVKGLVPTTDQKRRAAEYQKLQNLQAKLIPSTASDPDSKSQVYQLPVHSSGDKSLRYIVGPWPHPLPHDHDPGIPEKVLMLVGATGVGKSSLINAIVNHVYGTEWGNSYRLKLIQSEVRPQAHSQTKKISAYTFPLSEHSVLPYTLTVVDTPGLGDTEGIKQDRETLSQFKKFLSCTPVSISEIHCICLVVKADDHRLTPTQKYILGLFLSIFGKDLEDNIFIAITFCNGKEPHVIETLKTANIPCRESVFKFNTYSLYTKHDSTVAATDNSDYYWQMGMASFQRLFEHLGKIEPKSVTQTARVLQKRIDLESHVRELKEIVAKATRLFEQDTNDMLHNQEQLSHLDKELCKGVIKIYRDIQYLSEIALSLDPCLPADYITISDGRNREPGLELMELSEYIFKLKNFPDDYGMSSPSKNILEELIRTEENEVGRKKYESMQSHVTDQSPRDHIERVLKLLQPN